MILYDPEGLTGRGLFIGRRPLKRLQMRWAGGRIYGSGNAMSRCRPEAHLAFVLDTEAEALVEWLPRLPVLPETGGQSVDGGWWVLAGVSDCCFLAFSFQSRLGG